MLWSVSLFFIGAAVIAGTLLPDRHSPFGLVDLEAKLGFGTKFQLARLRGQNRDCRSVINASQMTVSPVPDRGSDSGCNYRGVVTIRSSSIPYNHKVTATCPVVAALYIWEREVVAQAARKHLGTEVTRIDHVGTYACRNTRGTRRPRLSQHARANAIDIAGFRFADGRTISVLKDWNGDKDEKAFLRAVHQGACRLFLTVLGPDYNAAHRDHFHFDMGRFSLCR